MKPVDPRIQQILDQIEVYQAIALEDYDVPAWQAIPIASAPEIAFRPVCSQVEPIWQADRTTAWVWEEETIYTIPGEASATPETLLNLQAAGVCITGSHAVDVPMVPTDEVFTKFEQATSGAVAVMPETTANVEQVQQTAATTAPATPQQGIDWELLGWVAVPIIALGLLARFVTGKQSVKRAKKRSSTQPVEHPETAPQPTDLEHEYDFQL